MDIVKKIEDYSLEEIMSLRFAAYAKEIIQDRAIPDVRDGLKEEFYTLCIKREILPKKAI